VSARSVRGALLLLAALAWGCKEEAAPPQEDRTLAKLRTEVDRVNKGGAPTGPPSATQTPEDPHAKLAGLAAGTDQDRSGPIKLPEPNPTVHVDTVAVKLTGLEATHSVKGSGQMGLTTEDLFLRVALVAENVGQAGAKLDLGAARVVDGENKEYPIARDAQVLAGTRQLSRGWEPGERTDLVLLFEVPPPVLGSNLTLVLPAASGDARLALK
jgi:hypothetical protein